MSRKYKFADNDKIYFVSFAVTNWINLFIRNEYKEEVLNRIRYCQTNKELELYGWSRPRRGDKPCASHYWYKRKSITKYNERFEATHFRSIA